jgi:hypothetical protein
MTKGEDKPLQKMSVELYQTPKYFQQSNQNFKRRLCFLQAA